MGHSIPLKEKTSIVVSAIAIIIFSSLSYPKADQVTPAIDYAAETNEAAEQSQIIINALDNQTRQMLKEYRLLLHKADSLKIYREQLRNNILAQKEERQSLERQIKDIDLTRREITPLMLRMIDTLEQFIATDIPFLPVERRDRIKRLRKIMQKFDVTVSEKYQCVLEAYQTETDYGRTIEAYRGELKNKTSRRTVDFLRIGRTALYYQTIDGRESGFWDPADDDWSVLPDRYRRAIQQGLRIARKYAAPELMILPMRASRTIK